MKEHPIIFNSEMVRAILEGRKTQTRRIVKDFEDLEEPNQTVHYCKLKGEFMAWYNLIEKCPYGQVGDRLWVRETWGRSGYKRIEYKGLPSDGKDFRCVDRWLSPCQMFKKDSRITLEITDVRVERLQEIEYKEILNEGIKRHATLYSPEFCCIHLHHTENSGSCFECQTKKAFKDLWNSIHKKEHTWEDNPWVWVISFKKLT